MDIEDISNDKYKQGAMPVNSRVIGGETGDDELRIFIDEDVLFKVDAYLASDINKELGGVFLGGAYKDGEGRKFIVIDNYIHAEHTNASVSRLTFTHETWEYINSRIDREFSGKMVLGWYHSHPGHTVFMSAHDMFIQENFFNMDFMTAYIYDPTINERAFFAWKNGRVVKLKGYYLTQSGSESPYGGTEVKKKPEELHIQEDIVIEPQRKGNNLKSIVVFILLGANLLLTALLLINYFNLSNERGRLEEVNRELTELRNSYKVLNQKLENFIIETELNKTDTVSTADVVPYVVSDGDTFESIAMKFFNDAGRKDTIMKVNNMKSDADISKGKIISIPIIK
jgi:proteasome lid subunit RPN8/RPN11